MKRVAALALALHIGRVAAGWAAVDVGVGDDLVLARRADGTVWAWGHYGSGPPMMRAPVAPLEDVVAIAAGFTFGVALTRDSTVWVWGDNARGQLGDDGLDGCP